MSEPTKSQIAQQKAALLSGYGAIGLRRVGNKAIVEVEHKGVWYEVITEDLDSYFGHIVEPIGILEKIESALGHKI